MNKTLPALVVLCVLLTGCGSEQSPLGPTPTPSPAPPAAFSGSVTDTVTGAPVAGFTALIAGSRLTVSAPGYVTRETRSSATSVDLIPEAGFDLGFYRELARGTIETSMQPLRVLSQAPSIYLQTPGLSPANVAALEQAARAVVPDMTGGRFQVQAWETGAGTRGDSAGWITVELVNDGGLCGRANVGVPGHVWLNLHSQCAREGFAVYPPLFAHELGHALGFTHVTRTDALMHTPMTQGVRSPPALERHHAAIAYKRQAGNRDVDVDR